ncbi:hypothetical protein EZS27_016692 [termite gut metagenome]|uniref:Uncharacterized protein n=1 Tax=termite gut metagenome TaxID=433724 RepID=A0A5J4RN05_9ZZZZ
MERSKRSEAIRNLKANGFRQVKPYPDLYLNKYGKIYSLSKDTYLKPTAKNVILYGKKRLSLPKLILFVFKGESIRENSRIIYINGSNLDLSPENIQYARKYQNGLKNEINAENLRTAIRCYFEVEKRYNVKDYVLTRIYLSEILKIRYFYVKYQRKTGLEVFKSYIQGLPNSHARTAKEHDISIHDCRYIVNGFINLLTNDILTDLQTGKLTVKEYFKKKTKTQELREVNEYLTRNGNSPLPLRKKSEKELLRDFQKCINELKKST